LSKLKCSSKFSFGSNFNDDDIDILDSIFWIPQYSTHMYAAFKEQVRIHENDYYSFDSLFFYTLTLTLGRNITP
jgi:hypothetical protein